MVDISISIGTRKTDKFALVLVLMLVALTSENWVDIGISISTRPWTNHRSF